MKNCSYNTIHRRRRNARFRFPESLCRFPNGKNNDSIEVLHAICKKERKKKRESEREREREREREK